MNKLDDLLAEKSLLEAVDKEQYANQRQLSRAIGLSLGKTHYLLRMLVEHGPVKVGNFHRSPNKMGYVYLMTAEGIKEKVKVTKRFLAVKEREYPKLEHEILLLREEVKASGAGVERR